jgi:parvulin-like peptidyl-prolyl isomerase
MTSKQLTQNPTSQAIAISAVDLIQQFKLSRQMPLVIAGVVKQKIIERAAIQQNITLSEEELQTAADRFRYEHNLIASADTLNWLNQHYLSITEFETIIKHQLLTQKLAQHLFLEQVEPYYYAHQLDYYQAIIYEIVISDFDLAMELYYGIQEQELSFWNLAHQYIEDRELRRCGGYQGKKNRKQLHPEIAAAVFSRTTDNLPQLLKPVAIDKKTHLIYVEEIIEPSLDQPLKQTILNQLFDNWLNQQRQQLIKNIQVTS